MSTPTPETPDDLLDAIRDAADDALRDQLQDRLIARFPPEALGPAVRARLDALGSPEGEVVLRLVEWLRDPSLWDDLIDALRRDPALRPDRAWLALTLLDEAGRLEPHPDLIERHAELDDAAHDEGTIDDLAATIEDDPDQLWVALQGMGGIEPEIRAEIVAGLATRRLGVGLVEFLRLLTFAHDPDTRQAALSALAAQPASDDKVAQAWHEIAATHPDPEVVAQARGWLGNLAPPTSDSRVVVRQDTPVLLGTLVTAVDGSGRGYVVLVAEHRGRRGASAFLCDVMTGIVEVVGQADDDPAAADELIAEYATRTDRDVIEQQPELALGLLAGSLGLCGASAPPALRFWLEATVGAGFRPRRFPGLIRDWDPASLPLGEVPELARTVLDTCPDWVDRSDLTYDLAEAIHLREADVQPSPVRDAGAYRFLFEHRLRGRLELYRRMLFWMASFWHAAGDADLGRGALGIAWQLSDPAHNVPRHPFLVELTSRSLGAAIVNLRAGIDPRSAGPP